MSIRLGWMKLSPSRLSPCTSSAAIVASDNASCSGRRSAPRPRTKRPLIRRPTQTPRLDRNSAAVPAAREVIQKRCGAVSVASTVLIRAASAVGLGGVLKEAEKFLSPADGVDDIVRAVVVDDDAPVGKPAARAFRAAQDCSLRAHLGER